MKQRRRSQRTTKSCHLTPIVTRWPRVTFCVTPRGAHMKAFRGRIICVSMIGSSDILRYPERGTYEGFSRSYHMCLDDRLICPRTHINTQTHTFFFADGRCGILHGLALGLSGTTLPEAEHTNEITPRPRASTHAKSPRPHPRRTSTHARTKFDHVCPAPHPGHRTQIPVPESGSQPGRKKV